jgi:transposase
MDLRERVVAACDEGINTRTAIAERSSVSESWIRRLIQRRRDTGSIAPKPHGGGQKPAFAAEGLERLRQAVADRPDATPAEWRDAVGAACGITAVRDAVVAPGLTLKQSRSTPPSRIPPHPALRSREPPVPGTELE